MLIGKLEIEVWKDTGTPKFRIHGCKLKTGSYRWYWKMMSYWTLWIALKR